MTFQVAFYYLALSLSLILKLKIARIMSAGRKAYNTKKSVVNRDGAPGKFLSMNWIPCENGQGDTSPVEALK